MEEVLEKTKKTEKNEEDKIAKETQNKEKNTLHNILIMYPFSSFMYYKSVFSIDEITFIPYVMHNIPKRTFLILFLII